MTKREKKLRIMNILQYKEGIQSKYCLRCGKKKRLYKFSYNPTSYDEYMDVCRQCAWEVRND